MNKRELRQRKRELEGAYWKLLDQTNAIARTGLAHVLAVRTRGFHIGLGEGLEVQLDAYTEAVAAEREALAAIRELNEALKQEAR